MIRISIFLLLTTSCTHTSAQQVYIETGKSISAFDYKNSHGEKLENLQSSVHTFLSIGARKNIFTNSLFLNLSANYNGYGATGSDKAVNNYFKWNLNYLGIGLGLDYEVIRTGKFGAYLKGGLSTEMMIQGTQTLNSQVYDLRKEKDFDSPFYFLRASAGVNYKTSDLFTFFTQYCYGVGNMFKNNQGDLNITEHRIGIGLFLSIAKRKKEKEIGVSSNQQIEEVRRELESQAERIKIIENNSHPVDSLNARQHKETELNRIKDSIKVALQPYKGEELEVNEVAGVLFITIGNDRLFNSGSASLTPDGVTAINNLGMILARNSDLNILIVGHTDNVPFRNNSTNNWELSVQRATAVVEIFTQNGKIDPKKLTAAGRGELDPIADNSTEAGRAKNRRIDIIISPNLERISELINE